jgi:NADH:ubiquinone reductase (H+-translocating)
MTENHEGNETIGKLGKLQVVVLGGGYAGLTAAARLGEASPDADITLIDAKTDFVERIRLHEVAAGSTPRCLPYAPFLAARNVRFVQARVTALFPDRHAVEIVESGGTPYEFGYDYLIYAPGSEINRAVVPGGERHAVALDSVESAQSVARTLASLPDGGRVLVAGGGLTAIEAAAEFAERIPRISVTLAAGNLFASHPGPGGLSPAGFGHVESVFRRLNITIQRTRVTAIQSDHAQLASGGVVPFDLCLWCAGFIASPIAAAAGVATDAQGAIRTDALLRSLSHPNIFAAGDGADARSDIAGKCRMSCATGRPMGSAAAQSILALLADEEPPPFQFGYAFRCISLGRTDGLIQFVNQDDSPRPDIWTGARAARWKEYICRRTLNGIGFESELGPAPDVPPPR